MINPSEELSLNTGLPPPKRSVLLRVLAAATLLLLFVDFAVPLINFLVLKEAVEITRYVIAIAQTLTLCWSLGHPLAVTVFSSAAFSHGLAWYVITMMVVLAIYLSMSIVTVVRSSAFISSHLQVAELVLLGVTLLLTAAVLLVALLKREAHYERRFGKNPIRLNVVSLAVAGVVAGLATTGLVLDYEQPAAAFHFPQLLFPNMFYFQAEPSAFSIVSSLLFLAALCAIPYTLTILRISIDKTISRSDRLLSIAALAVIVCCQLTVFICAMVTISRLAVPLDATIVLLLFVTGLIALRGVAYSLYVTCVVDKQIQGQQVRSLL